MKTGIRNFVMSQMDAMSLPGYFFWTWKVGNSSITGKVEAPFWSYQLGLQNGTSFAVIVSALNVPSDLFRP